MSRMVRWFCCFFILFTGLMMLAKPSFAGGADPFGMAWDKKSIEIAQGARFDAALVLHAPPDHYFYADAFDVEFLSLEGVRIREMRYPESRVVRTPVDDKETKVYRDGDEVRFAGIVPRELSLGVKELTVRVSYQGCSPRQCFPPATKVVSFKITVRAGEVAQEETGAPKAPQARAALRPGIRELLRTQDFSLVRNLGLVWALLIAFIAGLLSSLTPCVWPLIPVMFVVIGIERQHGTLKNVLLAASLVAGLVLMYALLGLAAVALGMNFGFLFQKRWFLALVVLFFFAMSMAMWGVFDLHISRRWEHRLHRLSGKGFRGAFLTGIGLGLIASPCTGPLIAALLGYVALERSYFEGFVLLVAYGAGMGFVMLVLGALCGVLCDRLRKGPWMRWVRGVLGVALLVPALFYLGSVIEFDGTRGIGTQNVIAWETNSERAMEMARTSHRPVMIDFYADWCPPCRALDHGFFARDDIGVLAKQLIPLRIDVTHDTDEGRALLKRFGVRGVPAIVFVAPSGVLYEDLRLSSPDARLIERGMREALSRAHGERL